MCVGEGETSRRWSDDKRRSPGSEQRLVVWDLGAMVELGSGSRSASLA